jgi:hypothetical protein
VRFDSNTVQTETLTTVKKGKQQLKTNQMKNKKQIELRNVNISLTHSEETILFKADVYVDGIKIAYAQNDGRGGSTFYHSCEGKKDLLLIAEEYCKTLPDITCNEYDFTYKQTLESVIDDLISEKVKEKEVASFKKKMEKATLNSIVWGKKNGTSFRQISWGKKFTIAELLKHEKGIEAVRNAIAKVKSEMAADEIIFNTNLTPVS